MNEIIYYCWDYEEGTIKNKDCNYYPAGDSDSFYKIREEINRIWEKRL